MANIGAEAPNMITAASLEPDTHGDAQPRLKAKTKAKTKVKAGGTPSRVALPVAAGRGGRASFLVRLWRAEGDDPATADRAGQFGAAGWRGVVEHIQSGLTYLFEDEQSLISFMNEQASRQHDHRPQDEDFDQFSPPVDD